jgi:hypothetical protein
MAAYRKRGRTPVKPTDVPVIEAAVVALVRSIEDLFETETWVGACTYRQNPTLRVVVRERAERVARLFLKRGGK